MQVTLIKLASIQLDVENPRIAFAVENTGNATDQYIEMALGKSSPADDEQNSSTTFSSLKASIKASGGLIIPIIVKEIQPDRYIVIEGNTRVAIYRELARDDKSGTWDSIPASIHENLEEDDAHAIRLQAHLVGPRPWRAYAKGKYLHYLYNEKNWSLNQLLDFCGGNARKREIEEYIDAYSDMQQHYSQQLQAGQGYSHFSAFVELQKSGIKPAIAKAGYTLDDFATWLANGHITPLNTVRQLPRILANPAAKKKFLEEDAREALKILDQPNPNLIIKDSSIEQLAIALTAKLRTEPWDNLKTILQDRDSPKAQAIIDCFSELEGFLEHMVDR